MGFLKKLFGREERPTQLPSGAAEKRFKERFAAVEGSFIERTSVAGLMMAFEADEVAEQRRQLTQNSQSVFMMGYECCMMWAIKTGLEKVLKPEQVQSAVLAMKRYLTQHGWYQAEAFEKIWAQTEVMMPIAMNTRTGPDAPPPYPLAEMLIGLDQAGHALPMAEMVKLTDVMFGMHMFAVMLNLTQASRSAAQDALQPK